MGLSSDASVREILLKLNQNAHFIIEDLDSNHLFVDGTRLEKVKADLDKKLSENIYIPSEMAKLR